MFSQNNEEEAILKFFGNQTGAFLDIGAFDGNEFSNTRKLAELGWEGVMVEPDARNFLRLSLYLSHLWGVMLIRAAVGGGRRIAQIHAENERHWASTLSQSCVKKHNINVIMTRRVPVIAPDDCCLLDRPFDFISLDAEHMDMEIFLAAEKCLTGCKLICVEKADQDWRSVLASKGFTDFVLETPENLLMARPTVFSR